MPLVVVEADYLYPVTLIPLVHSRGFAAHCAALAGGGQQLWNTAVTVNTTSSLPMAVELELQFSSLNTNSNTTAYVYSCDVIHYNIISVVLSEHQSLEH